MPTTLTEPAATTRAAVTVQRVAGASTVVRQRSSSLLKLLCINHDAAPWIYTSTYGGGLVAGDHVELDVAVGDRAAAVLTTQASTKVYHQQQGVGATHHLHAQVGTGGLLVLAPDPLTCFADAIYEQRQTFDLDAAASLVLLDWFTCGRLAGGERWAFERYASRNTVNVAGRTVIDDGLLLDRNDGPIDRPHRAGRCNCFATCYVVGDALRPRAEAIFREINNTPMRRDAEPIIAASRFDWGVALRIAGHSTERVGRALMGRLGFLNDILGALPWERKW